MKKGRHRRFEEARALKRSSDIDIEAVFSEPKGPCEECGAEPEDEHAGWCMAEDALEEEYS